MTLLVSLGTSPAIVPEAFLLPGADFHAVHVLTTSSIEEKEIAFVLDWFRDRAPAVELTVTRVAEFTDFKSEQDHFQFEEVLYRWWLERAGNGLPHVCLSGGFKTMSAAIQKAASVLGAAEVFHVLCDLPGPQQPKTAEEIEAARASNLLHWIKLGAEGGWPQFRHDSAEAYPLIATTEEGCVRWVRADNARFRERLAEIVQRSHRVAESWDRLGDLPFTSLATWSAADLVWLEQPLDATDDAEWVRRLPKVELHCHLGGFATHGPDLAQVRAAVPNRAGLPQLQEPIPPENWPRPATPIALPDYMKLGDANGSTLLKDPGCLRKQCELLYQHLCEQNVVYAEIRCSPANYASEGRSPWTVLGDIKSEFDRCMKAARPDAVLCCQVNLIIIATRKDGGDRSDISRHLALAITGAQHWTTGCRVVGVDLAGFEKPETRAALFATDFEPVHRVGLAVTVHAGENDDAEGIWQAVFKLNTRRLGHALQLIDAPDLLRAVADRGIGVEMCPFANYQIKGFPLHPSEGDKSSYPLLKYLRKGVRVTVNTDNIGISAASLTENLLLLPSLVPGLTRLDVLRLLSNAAQVVFLTPEDRAQLRGQLEGTLPSPLFQSAKRLLAPHPPRSH